MDPVQTDDRLTELRTSARGWHGVQLAVLGFIGLCGVLSGDSAAPGWLEWLSMWLSLAALACACLATFLVGAAAWPLYGARVPAANDDAEIEKNSWRVTRGLALTFVAVIVLALATASSWWPTDEDEGGTVEVQTASGQTACGELAGSQAGTVTLTRGGRSVVVPLDQVAALNPADC
jgi:hypothetical protein